MPVENWRCHSYELLQSFHLLYVSGVGTRGAGCISHVRFEILRAGLLRIRFSCGVRPCGLVHCGTA